MLSTFFSLYQEASGEELSCMDSWYTAFRRVELGLMLMSVVGGEKTRHEARGLAYIPLDCKRYGRAEL